MSWKVCCVCSLMSPVDMVAVPCELVWTVAVVRVVCAAR